MRLGFDLDGTLADMQAALMREARQLFPDVDPASVPSSTAGASTADADASDTTEDDSPFSPGSLTSSQQHALWKAVCATDNFWETLDEIEPGILARLYRVSLERKWEILFLTSRPESSGDTAQMQSHRWLTAHGFESPSVFVVHGSRGKISSALALDVFVDDRPENCLDIAIDSQARAILVWRGEEGKVPASARQLGIGSVNSIAECLDLLERLDRSDQASEGLIARFKRLLGLQPKATGRDGRTTGTPSEHDTALTRG